MRHNILLIDDNKVFCQSMQNFLSDEGFSVRTVFNGEEALALLRQGITKFSLVLVDYHMPDLNGPETIKCLKHIDPDLRIFAFSGDDSLSAYNQSLESGAIFFIEKGISDSKLLSLVYRTCLEIEKNEKPLVIATHSENQKFIASVGMIGVSESMAEVARLIHKFAQAKETVLIRGENGTGKELVAKAIHQLSGRRFKPFIGVNSAGIQPNLVESELFGHTKGSFTGAMKDKIGFIEAAAGGTLFLDEIGDMPLNLQATLLRVLQEKTIIPVGSTQSKKIDFRLVAATNAPLEKLVAEGKFREDLYYRLNVLPIDLKPLRDRPEDIEILALSFLNKYNQLNSKNKMITESAMNILKVHAWPGNVRELEYAIRFLANVSSGDSLEIEYFKDRLQKCNPENNQENQKPDLKLIKSTAEQSEKKIVLQAVKEGGSISKAAQILKVSRPTMRAKMKKYGVSLLNQKGEL